MLGDNNSPAPFQVRFVLVAALLAALGPVAGAGPYQSPKDQAHAQPVKAPEEKIDINSATLEQLTRVPGMTRTWAARIIRFRPYRAKNDLLDRGVVSSQVYERIRDYIVAHRAQ